MAEVISIPFAESFVCEALQAHLNKTFFKQPKRVIGIVAGQEPASFLVSVEEQEQKTRESRKPARGLGNRAKLTNGHTEDVAAVN